MLLTKQEVALLHDLTPHGTLLKVTVNSDR